MSSSKSVDPATGGELTLRKVRKSFGGAVAVDVDAVAVPTQGITALIGPNGAGKTTLFDIVSGFVRPTAGTVSYDGQVVTHRSPEWRARHGLVRTFQLTRVFTRLTVLENMLVGTLPGHHQRLLASTLLWRRAARAERASAERAMDELDRVGLQHVAGIPAGHLSGGQKKLLEFARALMAQPRLLLLDEPLAGVNPTLRESMLGHIRRFVDGGGGILLVEHDLPRVMQIADRVVVLDRGRVIADGSPEVITRDRAVIHAYLGGRHQ